MQDMVWDFALSLCWIASWYVMLQHPRSTRHGVSVGFLLGVFCFVLFHYQEIRRFVSNDSSRTKQTLTNKYISTYQCYTHMSYDCNVSHLLFQLIYIVSMLLCYYRVRCWQLSCTTSHTKTYSIWCSQLVRSLTCKVKHLFDTRMRLL